MSTKRMMSTQSIIYHRPGCKYINMIHPRNRATKLWEDSRYAGRIPCKHCNSMSFLHTHEQQTLKWNEENRGMEFKYMGGILYVKTAMGCWKLVYSKTQEQIALYHRNARQKPLDFKHPDQDRYHQQKDQLYFKNIAMALNYIYDHDKFRAAEKRGDKIHYKNEKYKQQAKKREKRAALRRMDRIFEKLEKEDKELKKYSMC